MLLGGTAGAISKTVSAPLERVKLLLQTQDSNKQLVDKKFKGIGDCFTRTYREEGLRSFWKGNWANVLRYFPTTAFNFAFKDFFNRTFNKWDSKTNPYLFLFGNVMAGGSAGACCMFLVYPLDLARTRLGVDVGLGDKRQFKGLTDCIFSILRSDGIRGLYNGILVSLYSIFLYRGLYFGSFDTAKRMIPDYEKRSFFYKYLLAQTVTIVSETIVYPFDTVRRRMMMNSREVVPIYSSTSECWRRIRKEEGLTAFYKGNLSNMMRSVSSSLVLVLYDEFLKSAQKRK
jgi:solute carrier family 25 (adenine nucleotide translocator) protein 4/5/6/31